MTCLRCLVFVGSMGGSDLHMPTWGALLLRCWSEEHVLTDAIGRYLIYSVSNQRRGSHRVAGMRALALRRQARRGRTDHPCRAGSSRRCRS